MGRSSYRSTDAVFCDMSVYLMASGVHHSVVSPDFPTRNFEERTVPFDAKFYFAVHLCRLFFFFFCVMFFLYFVFVFFSTAVRSTTVVRAW